VADVDRERAAQFGVEVFDPYDALVAPCDILAPCALGAVLTSASVDQLKCAAICGAANNQLLDAAADEALLARGIVYAPDFVVNAGGIINIGQEWAPGGYTHERALAAVAAIRETTTRVLELARDRAIPTGRAAEELGRERIQSEGAGRRWYPGDPA